MNGEVIYTVMLYIIYQHRSLQIDPLYHLMPFASLLIII